MPNGDPSGRPRRLTPWHRDARVTWPHGHLVASVPYIPRSLGLGWVSGVPLASPRLGSRRPRGGDHMEERRRHPRNSVAWPVRLWLDDHAFVSGRAVEAST